MNSGPPKASFAAFDRTTLRPLWLGEFDRLASGSGIFHLLHACGMHRFRSHENIGLLGKWLNQNCVETISPHPSFHRRRSSRLGLSLQILFLPPGKHRVRSFTSRWKSARTTKSWAARRYVCGMRPIPSSNATLRKWCIKSSTFDITRNRLKASTE